MKTLLIVRHAKSLHDEYVHSDLQRHLNERGYTEARAAALWCSKMSFNPDLFVSSPAIRTFTTAVIIAQFLGYEPGAIVLEEAIYEAPLRTLVNVVRALPDTADCVLMTGHNPGFSELAEWLVPGKIDSMKTAGVVAVELNISSWKDIAPELAVFKGTNQ